MDFMLGFRIETRQGTSERVFDIRQLVVAGWTGRDKEKMEHHMAELEAIGVKRPPTTPVFYRVAASRLTLSPSIQVTGEASSGEAEALVVRDGAGLWVGLASDHTDREVEAYGITVSKQMCDKPCAPVLWPMAEVEDHWDELVLRAFIEENGKRVLYQEGPLMGMLRPADLIERYRREGRFEPGTAMLCGTHAAIGGVRPSRSFEMELEDPVLGRRIRHGYEVEVLPVAG